MSTINVSMPDAMRDYVDAQAAEGNFSASEYIRHLIREDQRRKAEQERDLLWEYLAVSARQLDEGDVASVTVESLIAEGRARRSSAA
ncbi:MAG TPA: type II toxin-antitoxin system ParD family antitoxin [Stellaceae bacterium]|nr:type II toxin-antitoxin system ParD family antitoxin [Stellaceae bacterium]